MNKVNVIFLDFDGVVISPRAMCLGGREGLHRGPYAFDPIAIKGVNNLCNVYDAHVVISSTHRRTPGIDYVLRAAGFDGKLFDYTRFIDHDTDEYKAAVSDPRRQDHTVALVLDGSITDIDYGVGGFRGNQIRRWFDNFREYTKNYLILDDDSDFHPDQMKHLAQCDSMDGMGFDAFLKAENILKGYLE